MLLNLLRKTIKDKRVIALIKKYLKAGIMADGIFAKTEKGTPQGGPLSPLLANIYLNEFDQEMKRRGTNSIRYADDILILTKSKRAAEHQLESARKILEGKLKLTMNKEKSKVVSVFARKKFNLSRKERSRHLHQSPPEKPSQSQSKTQSTDKAQ